MASVTAKEIPEVQRFFTDLWNLYKKYYIPEDNDRYWTDVVSEFTKLRDAYKNIVIARPIILILLKDLDKRFLSSERSSIENESKKN